MKYVTKAFITTILLANTIYAANAEETTKTVSKPMCTITIVGNCKTQKVVVIKLEKKELCNVKCKPSNLSPTIHKRFETDIGGKEIQISINKKTQMLKIKKDTKNLVVQLLESKVAFHQHSKKEVNFK